MRLALVILLLLGSTAFASAQSMEVDGPVIGGGPFGMGGSDYYGDIYNRMPWSEEEAKRPIDAATVRRVMDEKRREANSPRRRAAKPHKLAHREAVE